MDEILHHFETMENHCSCLQGKPHSSGFLGGAGFRASTVLCSDRKSYVLILRKLFEDAWTFLHAQNVGLSLRIAVWGNLALVFCLRPFFVQLGC